MSQLWLIPVDERSFQRTLNQPIDVHHRGEKPDSFPDQTRVWGVRTDQEQGDWKRNRRNLDRMVTGDPLLVYRNKTSQYHAKGRIGEFWRTEYIRDEYWDGGPALDVFSIDQYEEIDVQPAEVNSVIDYKEQFWPQGLWRVADDRPTDRLVQKLDI